MESKLLASVGKVAGLGGIALGVVLLIFRGVLEKQFLPQAGLEPGQAFAVILSLMILTFGIAGIGVIAWLIARTLSSKKTVPASALGTLAGLIAMTIAAAVYVGSQSKAAPEVKAVGGGVAIGRDAVGTTINTGGPPQR